MAILVSFIVVFADRCIDAKRRGDTANAQGGDSGLGTVAVNEHSE